MSTCRIGTVNYLEKRVKFFREAVAEVQGLVEEEVKDFKVEHLTEFQAVLLHDIYVRKCQVFGVFNIISRENRTDPIVNILNSTSLNFPQFVSHLIHIIHVPEFVFIEIGDRRKSHELHEFRGLVAHGGC